MGKEIQEKSQENKKEGKYKYLLNNIVLFSVSNFVSKILVFLLVPFYTNVLSTADYGIADVMQTTLLLLVPALTINMGEAALRYGIDRRDKRSTIFRCGLKYVGIGSVIVAAVCLLASRFVSEDIEWYLFVFIFMFMASCTYEYMILFFQGCEKVQIVVCGSVFSTIVLITGNILFLLVFKIGLNGYLLSQILAYTMAVVLMLVLGRYTIPEVFKNTDKDAELEKELVSYGIPMIAYSTGSFINNAADRYLVAAIKGVAVNGIYGVAYKIPAILTVFQRIFAQAWQMSATKSYEDENSAEFFSTMYRIYNSFMVIGCTGLIFLVRPIAGFMFKKDFYEAWRYVPPLLISVVFGALTGFLGSICLANKDSKAMGIATGAGAAVNIVLNIILIPRYSAMGASVATVISYFLMYFIAYRKVCKYTELKVKLIRDYIAYVLLAAESVVVIMNTRVSAYVINAIIATIIIGMYFNEFIEIINKFMGKLIKK